MTKLSEAQRRVLEAMGDGAELATFLGRNGNVRLYRKGQRSISVRWTTYTILLKADYIQVVEEDWRGGTYTLTEAGRAALQQNAVGEGEG